MALCAGGGQAKNDAASNPRTTAARPCGDLRWETRTVEACDAPAVTLAKVQPGCAYAVSVSAANSAGESRPSSTAQIVTRSKAAPPPPPSPPSVVETSAAEAVLQWGDAAAPPGAPPACVEVAVGKVPHGVGGAAVAAWHRVYRGHETACLVTGLASGTSYVFRMREVPPATAAGQVEGDADEECAGPWSECASVTTLLAAPPPPIALVASARAPTSVRLTWQAQLKAGCATSHGYQYVRSLPVRGHRSTPSPGHAVFTNIHCTHSQAVLLF